MKSFCASLLTLPLLLAIVACSGVMMTPSNTRQLQSLAVTPASATAKNTTRQVQFTSMGTFNMAPMTAVPQVLWSVGSPFSTMPMASGVTINQNGLASCATFSGVVTVQATAPMDPGMSLMQMGS